MIYPLLIILLSSLGEPIMASSFSCKFNIIDDYLQNEGILTLHCHLPAESSCANAWKRGNNFILIDGRYQFLNTTPLSNSDDNLIDCSIVINQPNAYIDKDVFTCEGLEGKTMYDDKNPQSKQCTIEYTGKSKITVKTPTIPTDWTNQNSSLLHPRESANVDSDLNTICSLAFDNGRNGQIFLVILGIAVFSVGTLVGAVVVIVVQKVCLKSKHYTLPIKFENRTYFDPKCDFRTNSKSDSIYS